MIILKKADGLSNIEMVLTAEGLTWMEVSNEFISFLSACGYVVTGYEVGNHLCAEFAFQKEKEKDEPLVLEHECKPKRKRRKKNARTLQKR